MTGGAVVPFQRPQLPALHEIASYAERSYGARWFSNNGPCARLLSARLSERVDAGCVPVASATAGLAAAAAALVERHGGGRSEVLVPSFTFAATLQAVLGIGLRPRLLDVDERHWHLDPAALERELQARGDEVALVVAVTTFGTPPPAAVRERWAAACRAAGVPLLVDAAAAFGSIADDGVPAGRFGDVDVVSFHATKPFAIGEGGAVFSRDAELVAAIQRSINFGLDASGRCTQMHGANGKMSELHAATALAVLDRFDGVLRERRAAAAALRREAPAGLGWQQEAERSTWQFVPVALAGAVALHDAVERSRETVEVRRYYRPLHQMTPYAELPTGAGGLGVTDRLADRVLCFPMANDLTASELEHVGAALACAVEAPLTSR